MTDKGIRDKWFRDRISLMNKGKNNGMYGRKGILNPSFGKKRLDMIGENNPSWKGGIVRLYDKIRTSMEYNTWRFMIFKRDNFTCQKCGKNGVKVHAHHIKPLSVIIADNNICDLEQALNCNELWDMGNGVTLCKNCHKLTDTYCGNFRQSEYKEYYHKNPHT